MGYYVRRGEKIVGPVPTDKLKELAATGKVIATDELSQKPEGPWTPCGKVKGLFSSQESTAIVPIVERAQPPAVIDEPEPTWIEEPVTAILRVGGKGARSGLGFVAATSRAVGSASRSVVRVFGAGLQQRHERKLAELSTRQAEAEARAKMIREEIAVPAPAGVSQTVVVQVTQNNAGGAGCSNAAALAILGIIAIGVAIYSMPNPSSTTPQNPPTQQTGAPVK